MGKKKMKFYRICILFLLMSMSVFSSDQWVYTEVNKSDLGKTYKTGNHGYIYYINFNNQLDKATSLETENHDIEEVLESENIYSSTNFSKDNNYDYNYNGETRSMVKFELSKNQGSNYSGEFKYRYYKNNQFDYYRIDQNYNIPAPTTDFKEMSGETNTFTYTEVSSNSGKYDSQEVVFRLYTGNKQEGIRPIKKIEDNNLTDNSYVDFVFENDGSEETISKDGIIAKFKDEKLEIIGLKNNESYNLDFYTLRYGSNGDKNYVVATYENTLEFEGKTEISDDEDRAVIRTRIEGISSDNYNEIEINLISITNMDVKSMELSNIRETRENDDEEYSKIEMKQVVLNEVMIDGVVYTLDSDHKTIEKVPGQGDKKQYIYGWEGTYITKFVEEEGKERKVSFDAERTLSNDKKHSVNNLFGIYIEPIKSESNIEIGEQYIYSQVEKEKLDKTSSGLLKKYYDISFYEDMDELKSLEIETSLKEFLSSNGSFEEDNFTQKNEEVYIYNGEKRPMVEFKLTKNKGKPYDGTFKFIKDYLLWDEEVINEGYKIPAPTTNFIEVNLDPTKNIFTYDEDDGNKSGYEYQEVVFRLYTGNRKYGLRPIKKIEDNSLNNNSYIDFVFENNKSEQEVEKDGIKGRFIEGKFEIIGLESNKSYNLDFYTLRYRNNNNTGNYVVVTYESSLIFEGKNIINPNPTPKPSKQWIYSQIIKENLLKYEKESGRYKIDFYQRLETIKTIDEDGSLDELLRSDIIGVDGKFIPEEKERYKYEGEPKSIIEFKIDSNIGEPEKGKFELTVEENNVLKNKINENYMIPVPISNFKEQDLESSKNTFTFEDKYELEHIKAYKHQEVLFRLYTGSKHDELRPIKNIEENDFDLSGNNYRDFVFENNKSTQELEIDGIKARFIEGKFEIMGLEDNKKYNLDFYTLRYRNNNETGNYVAVTYEGSLDFIGKNIASLDDPIWLEDIDISEYKKIKLNMITITTEDLKKLDILDLIETRDGEEKKENYKYINTEKIELNKIWIGGEEYEVIDNQININDENKYVYKWIGSYETEFEQKNGKIREINFRSRRYSTLDETYKDKDLIGKYIEPTPVNLDTGDAYQWVMFEFNPARGFKKQDYNIEDRVLSPERKGYKQLKTISYASSLDDYLKGENTHSLIKEFVYSNGLWAYPEESNSKGLIIEKTITESKGILKDEDKDELIFYTDDKGDGIEKINEIGNKVTYRWNEGPLNTNGEILSYDKVIFRVTKKSTSKDYSWNPYRDSNPINLIEPTVEGNKKLGAFLYGNINEETYNQDYVDIVLGATTSKTMTFNNAIISYEQTNNELRIVGLPVDDYIIQFYSIKRGHDGRYKVITRENKSEFKMDISDIASEEFEKENNIHKIDFITIGEDKGDIRVNVNFITKMEREIDLKVENLKFGSFNMEEINEGTGKKEGIGEAGNITLKGSDMKRFLFPLDIVFVIDNSGSMQEEIDAVKNGLTAFGQELLDRGFDVKYNLITFGPEQNHNYYYNYNFYNKEKELYPTGDWRNSVTLYDRDYMAVYKDKWFDGSKLGETSSRENDLEELIDAFDNINALWGYDYDQENSAWGLHYAIDKLRTNGRYLSYSGEIVEKGNSGAVPQNAYMPSEKMIIFLTDENMDGDRVSKIPGGNYSSGDVLEKLYAKLNSNFKDMPDNIDLNGIFHVRKRGNTVEKTIDKDLKKYEKIKIKPDSNYGDLTLEYYYTNGKRDNSNYWTEYDDNEVPILGEYPSDEKEIYHTDFKYYNTANNFFMYEMGNEGQHVSKALTLSMNNLGIIQRWELSYLTPFNEYDGTTRTIDFELVNLIGKDKINITREIKNLNEVEDKQYTVKEEKLALEFKDPSVDNLKLNLVEGNGRITFRGKARYNEFDEDNKPIVVEKMINEYKLDVLDSNNNFLFSPKNITMSLSDEGWLENRVTKNLISQALAGRVKSDVTITNNSNVDILEYIDKARYTIDEDQNYKVELTNFEKEAIISGNTTKSSTTLNLIVDKTNINIEKDKFKAIVSDRSDTWYELNNSSETSDLLDEFLGNTDFEKSEENIYRIKLGDLGLKKLLSGTNDEGIELKISNTKLKELSDSTDTLTDTFGDQGWYEFKAILTDEEMDILKESTTVKSTEKINLEATIVTDLFNKTEILTDVIVDLSTPLITDVTLVNKTLFNFLDTMYSLDKDKTFSSDDILKYSGYDHEVEESFGLPTTGSTGKSGDKISIELIVEGKNLYQNNILKGIKIYQGSDLIDIKPSIIEISSDSEDETNKFKVTWYEISVSDSEIKVINNIKNEYEIEASQEGKILNVDNNDIEVVPTVKDIEPIEEIYYVNSNYSIDLGTTNKDLLAGIGILNYDKTKADSKTDEDGNKIYYGDSEYYYKLDGDENVYLGGEEGSVIPVSIDTSDSHLTDGEYRSKIYGMNISGKLKDITDYSSNDFKTIMGNNSNGENIIIRVDTISPKIISSSVKESAESLDQDNETYYYFDLSFEAEDFNYNNNEFIKGKGGHRLLGTNQEDIGEYKENISPTTYSLEVKRSELEDGGVVKVTIVVVDKAGNEATKEVTISIPRDIEINTYEELYQKEKSKIIKDSYKFTKGGLGSNNSNPGIYVTIPSSSSEDEKIGKLKIQTIGKDGKIEGEKIIKVSGGDEEKVIEVTFGFGEGVNEVRVTPINVSSVEGNPKEFKFVVDTKVNTSYLNNEIIGSMNGKNVEIDLSKIEELSGVEGYEYIFTVEGKISEKVVESDLEGKTSTTISGNSISGIKIIDTSDFIGGAKGTLSFTVYDKLGNEKTFDKTYFIPTKPTGITSTIEDEAKQRKSKVNIFGDTDDSKFSIENSIDGSNED